MSRLKARLRKFKFGTILKRSRITVTEPLGFLEFLKLKKEARVIVTDSGTVQEEALIPSVPCVVTHLRPNSRRTIAAGASILSQCCARNAPTARFNGAQFWDHNILNPMGGGASERIYG